MNKVRGQLSNLERKILSALIVVDVHARDVAAELASKGVSSESDFDFVSQLRCVSSRVVLLGVHVVALGLGCCLYVHSMRMCIVKRWL